MLTAPSLSVISCAVPFFERSLAIIQVFPARSISLHLPSAISSRRASVSKSNLAIGPNGHPMPSKAPQASRISSSLRTRSRASSTAGGLTLSTGEAAMIPRSIAQLHIRRRTASVLFAVNGDPRSTMLSRGLWMSARPTSPRRFEPSFGMTSTLSSRSISRAHKAPTDRLA